MRAALVSGFLLIALTASAALADNEVQRVRVDCTKGHSLGNALRQHGQTAKLLQIDFTGTCRENVRIGRDGVVLRGADASARILGALTVDGSTRITLQDFVASDSPEIGILIQDGSSATLRNVRVERSALRGVNLMRSSGVLENVTVEDAAAVGLLVRESTAELLGTTTLLDNGVAGVSITDGSALFLKGASIISNGSNFGLVIQLSSSMQFVDGTLNTDRNVVGLLVASGGNAVLGTVQFSSSNNSLFGIWVDEDASLAPIASVPAGAATISNNGVIGIFVEQDSVLELGELGATIRSSGNAAGLVIDNSSLRMADTVLQGNAVFDLILRFGARATFETNNAVTKISCDSTVVRRGPITCPAPVLGTAQTAADALLESKEFLNRRSLLSRLF